MFIVTAAVIVISRLEPEIICQNDAEYSILHNNYFPVIGVPDRIEIDWLLQYSKFSKILKHVCLLRR